MLPNIMCHLKAKTHNVDSPLAIHLMQKEKCLKQSVTSLLLNFNSSRMAFVKCVYHLSFAERRLSSHVIVSHAFQVACCPLLFFSSHDDRICLK